MEKHLMTKIADKVMNNVTAPSYTGGGIVVAYAAQTNFQVKTIQSKYKRDEIEG